MDLKTKVKLNDDQGVFVISTGDGYSCLGYDYCWSRYEAMCKEMKIEKAVVFKPLTDRGRMLLYQEYLKVLDAGAARNKRTGWRSKTGLTEQLNGLEGMVVRVVDSFDDERVFIVGKSTGWCPCHLEIESRDEDGGVSVSGAPFKSVKVIK